MFIQIPHGIKSVSYGSSGLNVLILVGRSVASTCRSAPRSGADGERTGNAGSKRHTARPAVYPGLITSENGQTYPGCAVYC